MTTLDLLQALPPARRRPVPDGLLDRVVALPMAMASRLRRLVRERQDTALLLRMGARDLADIGLTEADLMFIEDRDASGERRR